MGVRIDIKGKMNRNELYREKNKGPAYVPRFVTKRGKQGKFSIVLVTVIYKPMEILP